MDCSRARYPKSVAFGNTVMKFARIAIIVVAVGAALGAALLAKGILGGNKQVAEKKPEIITEKVLVAAADIGLGGRVSGGTLKWQEWPKTAISSRYITNKQRPNALTKFTGATARATIVAGEPILDGKLVKAGDGGFMAAILPSGMRAISVKISPETGAGGFILPNDRVDVIVTRRERHRGSGGDVHVSETVLTDVRVLAIDQALNGEKNKKDGQVALGKTATLALRAAQAERLALAEARGDISLALRSMADAGARKTDDDLEDFRKAGTVTIVRYGVSSQVSAKK